jgi:hypothetical protein
MGLDLINLTIRIEETFAIQIPDRIAPQLTTPGKVTDFILTQVKESQSPLPCLSQKAFYLLRRGFTKHLSLPRRRFKLDAALKELVPEEGRDDIWDKLGSKMGFKEWPSMSRHKWLVFIGPSVQSVRDLVKHVVADHPLVIKGAELEWSRAQVWEVLSNLIIEETAVTDFSEDSRFVQDMHLD